MLRSRHDVLRGEDGLRARPPERDEAAARAPGRREGASGRRRADGAPRPRGPARAARIRRAQAALRGRVPRRDPARARRARRAVRRRLLRGRGLLARGVGRDPRVGKGPRPRAARPRGRADAARRRLARGAGGRRLGRPPPLRDGRRDPGHGGGRRRRDAPARHVRVPPDEPLRPRPGDDRRRRPRRPRNGLQSGLLVHRVAPGRRIPRLPGDGAHGRGDADGDDAERRGVRSGGGRAAARSRRASAPTSSFSTRPALEHLVYHWGVNLVSDVLVAGERTWSVGGDLLRSSAS